MVKINDENAVTTSMKVVLVYFLSTLNKYFDFFLTGKTISMYNSYTLLMGWWNA